MIAPSGEQIEIAVGGQQAVVVEVGGGLRSYSAGSRELVDAYRADEMSRYEFDGRRHQLPLNEPEGPVSLRKRRSSVSGAQTAGGRRLRGRFEPQAARDACHCSDF
ncbi:MAG: hypothetical protein AUI16_03385 [Alphaproteobacteria bacterium 13_2_20CM_2_64_7]|nr:MAG: hypothetical protein AUI16_03385 [Alphaproteobacteria bacterium 13_2_20CM_2_64_7]